MNDGSGECDGFIGRFYGTLAIQSEMHEPEVSASPQIVLEMQDLPPHPRSIESEFAS